MHHGQQYLNPELHEVWHYDPLTGKFTSKNRTHGHAKVIRIGDEVGCLKDGYIQLVHNKQAYRAHVLAWVWMQGTLPPKGFEIDHKNRIRSDNKWANLRLLKRGANNLNHNGPRSDNTTGHRGVYRSSRSKTWFARITVDQKIIHLGTFVSMEDAIKARKQAEISFWNSNTTRQRM